MSATDNDDMRFDPLKRDAVGWVRHLTSGQATAADAEALQTMVFAIGRDHGFEPMKDWFQALYQVLLGADQGPRFGGFIALYGIDETRALIEKALAGELVAA